MSDRPPPTAPHLSSKKKTEKGSDVTPDDDTCQEVVDWSVLPDITINPDDDITQEVLDRWLPTAWRIMRDLRELKESKTLTREQIVKEMYNKHYRGGH